MHVTVLKWWGKEQNFRLKNRIKFFYTREHTDNNVQTDVSTMKIALNDEKCNSCGGFFLRSLRSFSLFLTSNVVLLFIRSGACHLHTVSIDPARVRYIFAFHIIVHCLPFFFLSHFDKILSMPIHAFHRNRWGNNFKSTTPAGLCMWWMCVGMRSVGILNLVVNKFVTFVWIEQLICSQCNGMAILWQNKCIA